MGDQPPSGTTLKTGHIAIFSLQDDLHALVIRKALEERFGVSCSFIVTNGISGGGGLTWSTDQRYGPSLLTHEGKAIDPRSIDLIWWRRTNYSQIAPQGLENPVDLDLINNDCRESLVGMLWTEFKGVWVNEPSATRFAENKLVQLQAAVRMGFRTPRTLVSQDPGAIRRFSGQLHNDVIVKAVKGTIKAPVLTTRLHAELLCNDEALRMSPAIYQELIPGNRHLRVQCFGEEVLAAAIDCDALDWRPFLDSPAVPYRLPDQTEQRLRAILVALGLKMGVFDFKLDEQGEPVWLEVNPQSQFLFVQGMSGLNLEDAFCRFLCHEMKSAGRNHSCVRG
jgi:glutathione synthase/RimK-type ligase-like ATP-grasp enzyme